jgi:hypothetical protein
MAIRGIELNRNNPKFLRADFVFWMPQFKNYINTNDGLTNFNKLREIANQRIYKSIFGADWEYAMSLCIAHYFKLIGDREKAIAGATLSEALVGSSHQGILTSASIGGFNKTLEFESTMINSDEAKFWNLSDFGKNLMVLYKTKAVPSMFVVTME